MSGTFKKNKPTQEYHQKRTHHLKHESGVYKTYVVRHNWENMRDPTTTSVSSGDHDLFKQNLQDSDPPMKKKLL
jgi:hypothetical protein